MGCHPASESRASHPDAPNETDSPETKIADLPEMEFLTIPQILTFLQSSHLSSDFDRANQILQSRQDSLRSKIEQDFLDDIILKEVEKTELQIRCTLLERNLAEEKEKATSLAAKLEESAQEIARLKGLYDAVSERDQRIRSFLPKDELGNRLPLGVIELSDSEDDVIIDSSARKRPTVLQGDEKKGGVMDDDDDDDDEDSSCSKNYLPTLTPKWKCALRVITSDSEEEEDDNVPLSKLKKRKIGDETDCALDYTDIHEEVATPRRRLVPLRELDETKGGVRVTSPRNSTPHAMSPSDSNKRVLRNRANVCLRIVFSDADDAGLESEDESMGGFIVDNSDGVESKDGSSSSSEEEEEEQSDSDVDLGNVLARIHREKECSKWEYEADMLSAFAKNDELCMKAVCDIWRLQTDEEQKVKQAVVVNNQGFNKLDADRGSTIAEFLTDGDQYGLVKKTVKELQDFDPQGVEYCRNLAFRYSGQLFSIYRDRED